MERNDRAILTAKAIGFVACLLVGAGYVISNKEVLTMSAEEREVANKAALLDKNLSANTEESYSTPGTQSIPEYSDGYITRNEPRARYKITHDPSGTGRTCVLKTNESPANTLVGMTVVLGADKEKYDGSGVIYNSSGVQIGVYGPDKLIGFEDMSEPVYADAVACANN